MIRRLAASYANLPQARFAVAQAALAANDEALALAEVREAALLRPDWEVAALFEAQVLQAAQPEAAAARLAAFLEKYPDSREVRLNYARVLVGARKYDQARAEFERLAKANPNNPDLLYAVGLLAVQAREYGVAEANLKRALDLGVDVVGGIPHFERTYADGTESVKILCELAAERGKRVDMHCDESDDPHSRHVETLAYETQRLGLHGRVTGSHLTSMHSMDNYYVSKLIPLMAEANLGVVANPLINITLQGRHDTYPKRRGMTRVPELMAAGLTVAFGHDCVLDPWYSGGSADMLEAAHMGLHVGQMTSQAGMRQCFDAVTVNPARLLGLEGYGIAPGCHADFVLLHARSPVDAIRLRAARLGVWRRGQRVAGQPAPTAELRLPGRPGSVNFL